MNTAGDTRVFYILIPLFMAVGVYLLVYSRNRAVMLRRLAKERDLKHTPKDDGQMATELDKAFYLPEPGYARAFMRVRDIVRKKVQDGAIALMRFTELLDLNPRGQSGHRHGNHLGATFPAPAGMDLFMIRQSNGHYVNQYPPGRNPAKQPGFETVRQVVEADPPAHPLSITFSRGRGLVYLMPLRTGSEKLPDARYLFGLAERLHAALRSGAPPEA
jgi:hypothetical protein